jgi:hypothetical protein
MLTQGHRFFLVLAAGLYVQQSVLVHYTDSHWGAHRGRLQARREKRQSLQVPARMIEASANIGDVRVV